MLLALALLACSSDPTADPFTPPVDDPAVDTDHGHEPDLPALPPRPLCAANDVPAPAVEPDIADWVDRIANSSNRFFGEDPWRELDGLGESFDDATAEEIVAIRLQRAFERLKFGDVDGAVDDADKATTLAIAEVPALRGRAREILASAWMRKAELQNCVSDGTGEACLVPFSEEGEHRLSEGMTNAIEQLTLFLTEDEPGKLGPRWLLNVAHMALGTYPDEVPPALLVDPALLVSEAEAPVWPNIAPYLGARELGISGGASIDDYDGDGLNDVLVSSYDPKAGMKLFLNVGDGTLCDASHASGLSAVVGSLNFAPADYDNDGDLDIVSARGAWMNSDGQVRPALLRNDGSGRFTDVAVGAGLANVVGPSQTVVWGDLNNDGWLDIFYGREADDDSPTGNAPSSLYISRGDGTFRDIGPTSEPRRAGFVKGAAIGDIDNDGDLDLYVSTLRGDNRLYANRGDATFIDITVPTGVQAPQLGFATGFADFDQDGFLDIFAASYANTYGTTMVTDPEWGKTTEGYVADLLDVPGLDEPARIYRNLGDGFEDVTEAWQFDDVHATMGANIGDLNADGWPDVYLGTGAPAFDALEPNVAYYNLPDASTGRRFADVTFATHTGHLQKGHGVSFGDLDGDGDEDLLAQMGGAYRGDAFPDAIFLNPTADPSAVTLCLEGVPALGSNRSAIGARVRVVTPSRTFHYVVSTGASFGANSLAVEVTLSDEDTIERVEIDWPGGSTEVVTDVPLRSKVKIRQGEGVVSGTPFAPIVMRNEDHGHD
jgi:hypothetical protein